MSVQSWTKTMIKLNILGIYFLFKKQVVAFWVVVDN